MNNKDLVKRARKRVKEKKEFYSHLISFVSTMLFLIFINLWTSPEFLWFFFPLFGWGIGLTSHYFKVFGFFGRTGSDWEEKAIEKELKRLKSESKEDNYHEESLELEDEYLDLNKKVKSKETKWREDDLV